MIVAKSARSCSVASSPAATLRGRESTTHKVPMTEPLVDRSAAGGDRGPVFLGRDPARRGLEPARPRVEEPQLLLGRVRRGHRGEQGKARRRGAEQCFDHGENFQE